MRGIFNCDPIILIFGDSKVEVKSVDNSELELEGSIFPLANS